MNLFKSQKIKRDTKMVFFKKGTCSRTFFFLLNREFGFPHEDEERAADQLAGGIVQQGYQCGMLWGATLALGAESYRRTGDSDEAISMSIRATRHIMQSFTNRAKSADCLDITSCDFSNRFSIAKYFFTGKMFTCFKLAEKWAPEAFEAAEAGLSIDKTGLTEKPVSCASEVVKKMGASEEEISMVSGFAGGIGLSGNGCGALAAAIWINSLDRVRKGNFNYSLSDPVTDKIIKAFYEETDYKMECHEITGKQFKTLKEHTEFIKNGYCNKLISVLADNSSNS